MPVTIARGAVVRLDDVVAQLQSTGLGQLELTSDSNFIATSRTYYRDANGTHGDRIAAFDATSAGTSAVVGRNYGAYWNLGIANVTGSSGIVRVNFTEYPIAPYGHIQFGDSSNVADFQVVSGSIRIIAYASVTENDDFAVYPAEPRAPKLSAVVDFPSLGPWHEDIWAVDASDHVIKPPRSGGFFDLPAAPAGGAIFERIEHQGESESISHDESSTLGTEVIGLEVSDQFRVNFGTNTLSDVGFFSSVSYWDAQGNSLGTDTFFFGPGNVRYNDPRVARITTGFKGWASVVDNRSGDATYIPAQ